MQICCQYYRELKNQKDLFPRMHYYALDIMLLTTTFLGLLFKFGINSFADLLSYRSIETKSFQKPM